MKYKVEIIVEYPDDWEYLEVRQDVWDLLRDSLIYQHEKLMQVMCGEIETLNEEYKDHWIKGIKKDINLLEKAFDNFDLKVIDS